jgi:MFS family permease
VAETPGGPAARRPRGGLLRQRNFRLLWAGETVSDLGDGMAVVAMPLVAVAVLHASALGVSGLTAATYLPYLVLGLPAGAWVDRLPPRPVMITCDLAQLVLFASLPAAAALGILSLAQLLAVALLTGTAGMIFGSAYTVYLTVLVGPDELMEGNAKLQGSSSATRVVGPGLGGLAAQALGPVASLLLNAASFLASAGCLLRIRHSTSHGSRPRRGTTIRQDIAEGLRLVFRDRYLLPLVIWAALTNFGLAGYFALIVVFLVRSVGLSAGLVGLLLTAGGLGGVLGAMSARRLADRFGTARTLVANCALSAPGGLLMVFAHRGPALVFAAAGVFALEGGLVLGSVILVTFRQGYVAPQALGRVGTSMRMVTYGVAPVGALTAGALGNAFGPRTALAIMLGIDVAATGLLLTGPFRGRRDLPVRDAPGP